MIRKITSNLSSSQGAFVLGRTLTFDRFIRHQAFDASFDQDELAEARKWQSSFRGSNLPKGQTSYSRSSGPGGQHVNKTESKATTVWPVEELAKGLPKVLQSGLRSSKYYTSGNDSITIQAQTQRSRSANTNENFQKLAEELQQIYRKLVPGATSDKKMMKYEALEKAFHESRIRSKKQHSAKKASRKGSSGDY
ncbi:uncharacterized protein BCR38DRAFT_460719 [Pseudomassariella vexata]|uniref:Prokaryotic-type class I peptide chain release factors domain-containing protein n=1 Tax=Pseudomassariella vexata TaxID=1141098 RepID=A0A1Y2DI34_9PEZI|nr:uncharacterized protein BCR38DRAFT_460719 [Pseudomassariella vexata]ORY58880.1 hypothetical protein BCR38DRAFT_460719 [Pseudomassariella vexata]